MATYMSNQRKTSALNWLRGQAETPPSTVYAALFTSDPGPTGLGNEVIGGGYTRVAIPWSAVSIDDTTYDATLTNSAAVTFPEATQPWGTVGWLALMDAPSGGNVIYSAPLTAPRDVQTGDNIAIKANRIIVVQQ